MTLEELCRAWQATPAEAIASRIVTATKPLVLKLAMQRRRTWKNGGMIDLDDLISVGLAAVHESIPRFSPARGVKFLTFVGRRITGAMMDEMRAADPLTRTQRRRADEAGEQFVVGSIHRTRGELGLNGREDDSLEYQADGDAPADRLERRERFEAMLVGLSAVERLMMRLRYVEDLTMAEIGRTIGVSESRVSQQLANIHNRLKARLERSQQS